MAMKITGEVVSVEKKSGYINDYLLVTVKDGYGSSDMILSFRVPLHRARSYPIGREVVVGVGTN